MRVSTVISKTVSLENFAIVLTRPLGVDHLTADIIGCNLLL
jgi:hypothetical protein